MQTKHFILPEWDFVGGETQNRTFVLYKPDAITLYNIEGGTAAMTVVDFVNPRDGVVLTKDASVSADPSGAYCEVRVSLSPSDTVSLKGKFIYQLAIKDKRGNIAVPKGIMHVSENYAPSFVV